MNLTKINIIKKTMFRLCESLSHNDPSSTTYYINIYILHYVDEKVALIFSS